MNVKHSTYVVRERRNHVNIPEQRKAASTMGPIYNISMSDAPFQTCSDSRRLSALTFNWWDVTGEYLFIYSIYFYYCYLYYFIYILFIYILYIYIYIYT
jgi:hypothetical protein